MASLSRTLQIDSNGGVRINASPSQTGELIRRDIGYQVPIDGATYVMVQHEIIFLGTTRHNENKPNDEEPRPAVANASWGVETLAKADGDYYPIQNEWQQWFFQFWDWASGYKLPMGEKIGTHVNPKNPNIVYTDYTPGSKLSLYARMIMDAKSHTDSASPETGARDVVTGRNLASKTPWAWLCRPTTGAILRVIKMGSRYKAQAIDLNSAPPDVNNLQIWQYYFGTQVDRFGNVTRYPDVKEELKVHGYGEYGTAMPLVAPGGYFYIDKRACIELAPGQMWTPYYQHKK